MINYTVDGLLKTLTIDGNPPIPKKITLELSEDGKFYKTRIYGDFSFGEGWMECRTGLPSFANDLRVYPDSEEDGEIFTITIPEESWHGRRNY